MRSKTNVKRRGSYFLKQKAMYENCFGSDAHQSYGDGLASNAEKSVVSLADSRRKVSSLI